MASIGYRMFRVSRNFRVIPRLAAPRGAQATGVAAATRGGGPGPVRDSSGLRLVGSPIMEQRVYDKYFRAKVHDRW